MTNKELEVEVTFYRVKEKELLENLGSLRKELEVMKAQIEELKRQRMAFDPKKYINKRTVDLENGSVGTVFSQRMCRASRPP